ncbi:MAG TPA: BadF/BadG/BcrA/BcrD ATPase family protein [Trebonia sp.]|nr:BadF/BadG/BcrA/BcrD ATPase family protein [Trebonia sp.]
MNNEPLASPPGDLPAPLPWSVPGPLPGRLLGIDAGGGATRVALVAGRQVVRRQVAPPMNALLTEDVAERLLDLVTGWDATAAGIGLPGLRSPAARARLAAELTSRAGCPVYVTGDGETALLGAFGARPGIAVFAGTGSGATGWDGRRWARAGGHGFLLGDEGSAYWIGRAAVNAALRWEDGMGGSAALRDAVVRVSGSDLAALVAEVHAHPSERQLLSRLAPAITELAGEDETARYIAERAAIHLAALAQATRAQLGPLPVCGLGGVLRAPVIWHRFAELTGATRPLAPPEIGAALLAWRGGLAARNEEVPCAADKDPDVCCGFAGVHDDGGD